MTIEGALKVFQDCLGGDNSSRVKEALKIAIQVFSTVIFKGCGWNPISKGEPVKDGEYLCTTKDEIGLKYIEKLCYAKDLYSADKYDFKDKKGKSGWYMYDRELGKIEVSDTVIAWMPLPGTYVE